jgi:glucose/arabinose dehydrogenase
VRIPKKLVLSAIVLASGWVPVTTSCGGEVTHTDQYSIESVVTGIDVPWGMVWLPDGDMLVSDRGGSLFRVASDGSLIEVEGLPDVHVNGQGGLLDLELHPAYPENGWVYLSYSSRAGGGGSNTAIARARL